MPRLQSQDPLYTPIPPKVFGPLAVPEPPAPRRGRKPRRWTGSAKVPLDLREPRMDPYRDERQTRAFDLSIQGFSNAAIGKLLGVTRQVIAQDIVAEATRRADERRAEREAQVERAVSRYEKIAGDSALRVQTLTQAANAEPSWKAKTAYRAIVPREVAIQVRALRQADEVQGLLAKPSVTQTNVTVNGSAGMEAALEAFASFSPDQRAEMRRMAREQREAQMKNVTS